MSQATEPLADRDSERAVLAACISAPDRLDALTDSLSESDFHDPDLGALYGALRTLHESGVPLADIRVVLPELRRMKLPDAVLAPQFLGALISEPFQANHATFYAVNIRRLANLRKLESLAQRLLSRVREKDASPAGIASAIDAQVAALTGESSHQPLLLGDSLRSVIAEVTADNPPEDHGVFTGLLSHDSLVGAWQPGELVILGARPSVGKTSLGQQVALHQASKRNAVGFASLEMTHDELTKRYVSSITGIDIRKLRGRSLSQREKSMALDIEADLRELPLVIWSPPSATLSGIRAFAKKTKAIHGLKLLVVDYVGLVTPADPKQPRHEQVAAVTRGLKAIAKEMRVPVLCLCQLNRAADEGEPRLIHLRESGAIEQDADVVLFLHRERETKVKLIVAKQRNGSTGAVHLKFDPARTRFTDWQEPLTSRSNYEPAFEKFQNKPDSFFP